MGAATKVPPSGVKIGLLAGAGSVGVRAVGMGIGLAIPVARARSFANAQVTLG